MLVRQYRISGSDPWPPSLAADPSATLVLVFGAVEVMDRPNFAAHLAEIFPQAALVGCSTAGEITAEGASDGGWVLTALRLDHGRVRVAEARVAVMADSRAAGGVLGRALAAPDLTAVLLFGKGIDVNGSALIEGVMAEIGATVPLSGGLAGDGGRFAGTLTLGPSGISPDTVAAVGLYGERFRIGHGSFGGWVPFGPARKVTRCDGNILYELDGMPALDLYRQYLGEYAKDLPASGLLFPFEMLDRDHGAVGLIRTILGVDAERGALILAGDIDPEGSLRLMHASTDNLVDGAENAARRTLETLGAPPESGLGLLVSCVGRKLVMGDNVDEEVEAVASVLGRSMPLAGFYSYGEIAPFSTISDCKLHNQTMTVTVIAET